MRGKARWCSRTAAQERRNEFLSLLSLFTEWSFESVMHWGRLALGVEIGLLVSSCCVHQIHCLGFHDPHHTRRVWQPFGTKEIIIVTCLCEFLTSRAYYFVFIFDNLMRVTLRRGRSFWFMRFSILLEALLVLKEFGWTRLILRVSISQRDCYWDTCGQFSTEPRPRQIHREHRPKLRQYEKPKVWLLLNIIETVGNDRAYY